MASVCTILTILTILTSISTLTRKTNIFALSSKQQGINQQKNEGLIARNSDIHSLEYSLRHAKVANDSGRFKSHYDMKAALWFIPCIENCDFPWFSVLFYHQKVFHHSGTGRRVAWVEAALQDALDVAEATPVVQQQVCSQWLVALVNVSMFGWTFQLLLKIAGKWMWITH